MEYKHFSHEHNLNIHQVQERQKIQCSGCETPCHDTDTVYACWPCNYFLHDYCGNANRYIKHPADAQHHLILVPKPTYCSGSFICNACGETGSAFSYSCAPCEVDLHVQCAFLPLRVSHKSHQHELKLYLSATGEQSAIERSAKEFCKICTKVLDTKHWCYFCYDCDFGTHTFCVPTEVKPGLYVDNASGSGTSVGPPPSDEAVNDQPTAEEVIVGLYNLKIQMDMADQLAKVMGSYNPNA